MGGRRGEKVLTTWEFQQDGLVIKIPVKVVDCDKKSSYHNTGPDDAKTYFSVSLSHPFDVNQQSTDINLLRKSVIEEIKSKLTVKWKPVLVVCIKCTRNRLFSKKKKSDTPDTNSDAEGILEVTWKRFQIAEFQGKKINRSFSGYWNDPFSRGEKPYESWHSTRQGWPEVGVEKGIRSHRASYPDVYAMIDDTPEHREALEMIGDNIEKLYDGLRRLLQPKNIEKTLAAVLAKGSVLKLTHEATK